jgi:hypothetical protein
LDCLCVDVGSDNLFGIFLWPLDCLCVDLGSDNLFTENWR